VNLAARLARAAAVAEGICTAKTPPKGPAALLLLTLTKQRLVFPLMVPVQAASAGSAMANGYVILAISF